MLASRMVHRTANWSHNLSHGQLQGIFQASPCQKDEILCPARFRMGVPQHVRRSRHLPAHQICNLTLSSTRYLLSKQNEKYQIVNAPSDALMYAALLAERRSIGCHKL